MPIVQELTNAQINDALEGAAQKHIPLTLTIRCGNRWINLRSRGVAVRAEHLIVEFPVMEDGFTPYEFAPAERVGGSFKLKHYKHIFSTVFTGTTKVRLDDGQEMSVVSLCAPTKMQRLQRRAYFRVEVPGNRIVRASIWLGGCENEPAGTSPERPVWTGQVLNISAGGFRMRTGSDATYLLDPNDVMGTRLIFGTGRETVYADAQLRHAEPSEGGSLMGLQFLGLAQTPQGLKTLQFISSKVGEFIKANQRATARARA